MRLSVISTLLLLFLSLPSIAQPDSSTDSMVIVLKPEDPAPHAGVIERMELTGNDPNGDCSAYELQQLAKSKAAELGANVVKIVAVTERSRQQHCDMLTVEYYQVPDARALETSFPWSRKRPLQWADFKAPVRSGAPADFAAETSCGFGFATNTLTGHNTVKIYVFNAFETQKSWVRAGQSKPDVLRHEQGHFDICELFTRRLRERFSKATLTISNLHEVAENVYRTTQQEYIAYQNEYERQTAHGTITEEQDTWTARLAHELSDTEQWTSP